MIDSPVSPDPWSYIQDWDVEYFGPEIRDANERRRWETTFAIAGGLPYIWQVVARPISHVVYGLLEAKRGDRVLIIGEGVGPAKWADDLRAMVGPSGAIDVVEIIRDGRDAVMQKKRGRNGKLGCWQWTYGKAAAEPISFARSSLAGASCSPRPCWAARSFGSVSKLTCTWHSGTPRCFRHRSTSPKSPTIRAKS